MLDHGVYKYDSTDFDRRDFQQKFQANSRFLDILLSTNHSLQLPQVNICGLCCKFKIESNKNIKIVSNLNIIMNMFTLLSAT